MIDRSTSVRVICHIERMRKWKRRKFCYVQFMKSKIIIEPALFYCPYIPIIRNYPECLKGHDIDAL